MKKLLALLVIFALVLTVAVGCQRDPATEEPGGNVTEPGGEEPTSPDDTTDPGGTEGTEGSWVDGTYNAESEPDERGYTASIDITVENGYITEVRYDETSEEGVSKREDEDYADRWEAASGVRPEEAYQQLENDLIDKQDINEVDAVSGATSTTEKFRELVEEALPLD